MYIPLLRVEDNSKGAKKDDANKSNALRDPLYSLRAGLRMQILRGGTNVQNDNVKFKGEEFRGVLDPIDEINIWADRM